MKKYAALLLLVASVAGLGWAGMLTLRMVARPAPVLSATGPTSLHAKEGEEALQRLRRIDQILTKINELKPLSSQVAVAPLAQPAPLPVAAVTPSAVQGVQQQAGKAGPMAAKPAPVISMVYLSTNMARAVINGKLYGLGDSLPDGGMLLDISLSEVVIGYKGRRKVLPVPRSQVSGSTAGPVIAK